MEQEPLLPDDFMVGIKSVYGGLDYFYSLQNAERLWLVAWVGSGKRHKTRQMRIDEIKRYLTRRVRAAYKPPAGEM